MTAKYLEIKSSSLIERYNQALFFLTKKTTALASFRIDKTGYSPEIARELGDHYYLCSSTECTSKANVVIVSINQLKLENISHFTSIECNVLHDIETNNLGDLIDFLSISPIVIEFNYSVDFLSNFIESVLNKVSVSYRVVDPKGAFLSFQKYQDEIALIEKKDDLFYLTDSNFDNLSELRDLAFLNAKGKVDPLTIHFPSGKYDNIEYYSPLFGGFYCLKSNENHLFFFKKNLSLRSSPNKNISIVEMSDASKVHNKLAENQLTRRVNRKDVDLNKLLHSIEIIKQKIDHSDLNDLANKEAKEMFVFLESIKNEPTGLFYLNPNFRMLNFIASDDLNSERRHVVKSILRHYLVTDEHPFVD